MAASPLPPLVLDGWYVLHQSFRIRPEAPEGEGVGAAGRALVDLFASWEDLGDDGWSGLYRIVGGGTDLLAMHLRPTLEGIGDAERALRQSAAGPALELVSDYVSTVELGLYATTAAFVEQMEAEGVAPGSEIWNERVAEVMEQERAKTYVQQRLQPRQPEDMPYVCFYPMDKRRGPGQNWYALPLDERARLMGDHGQTGRRYRGRVSQIISGSVGFDDWEWAVTLFAGDPLEFKNLVTEMRYDVASSEYAEFGDFIVGYRLDEAGVLRELGAGDGASETPKGGTERVA